MVGPIISTGPTGSSRYAVPNYAPIMRGMTLFGQGIGKGFESLFDQQRQEEEKRKDAEAFRNLRLDDPQAFREGLAGMAPKARQQALTMYQLFKPTAKKADPFTLSPGQVRYDAAGNVVARGPDKPAGSKKHRTWYHPKTKEMKAIPEGSADATMLAAQGFVPGTPPRPPITLNQVTGKMAALQKLRDTGKLNDEEYEAALRGEVFGKPGESQKKAISSIQPARQALSDLYTSIATEDAGWWWDERGQKQNQLFTILKSQVINLEERGANFTGNEEKIINDAIGNGPTDLGRKLFDALGGGKEAYLGRLRRFAELIEQKAAQIDPAIKGKIESYSYPWANAKTAPTVKEQGGVKGAVRDAVQWASGMFGAGGGANATEPPELAGLNVDPAPEPLPEPRPKPNLVPGGATPAPGTATAGLDGLDVPSRIMVSGGAAEPGAAAAGVAGLEVPKIPDNPTELQALSNEDFVKLANEVKSNPGDFGEGVIALADEWERRKKAGLL